MTINKFSKIAFPFFGFKEKPYEINITFDRIEIKKHKDSHFETVDNKYFIGDIRGEDFTKLCRKIYNIYCLKLDGSH